MLSTASRRAGQAAIGFIMVTVTLDLLAMAGIIPVLAMQSFASPALTGLISRQAGPRDQGQLSGASISNMAIAALFAPFIYTASFAGAIGARAGWRIAGAPFLIAATLVACGLAAGLLLALPPQIIDAGT